MDDSFSSNAACIRKVLLFHSIISVFLLRPKDYVKHGMHLGVDVSVRANFWRVHW